MNGLGDWFMVWMYVLIAAINFSTLVNTPRRSRLPLRSRKKRSTMFSQDARWA